MRSAKSFQEDLRIGTIITKKGVWKVQKNFYPKLLIFDSPCRALRKVIAAIITKREYEKCKSSSTRYVQLNDRCNDELFQNMLFQTNALSYHILASRVSILWSSGTLIQSSDCTTHDINTNSLIVCGYSTP